MMLAATLGAFVLGAIVGACATLCLAALLLIATDPAE